MPNTFPRFHSSPLLGLATALTLVTAALLPPVSARGQVSLAVDTSFVPGIKSDDSVTSAVPVPGGDTIYVTGASATTGLEKPVYFLRRLKADGTLDTGFKSPPGIGAGPIAAQADGKVLAGGNGAGPYLARYNLDGGVDTSFQTPADPTAFLNQIVPLPNGKFLVGGNFTSLGGVPRNNVARLNADGSLDAGFVSPADAFSGNFYDLEAQPDGKVVVIGNYPRGVLRLNADGGVDTGFVPGSPINTFPLTGGLQPDGKILVAGDLTGGNGGVNIVRLNPDGGLDTTFNPPNVPGDIGSIVLQRDGKIIVNEAVTGSANPHVPTLLNNDGSVDPAFKALADATTTVPDTAGFGVLAIQADGKYLVRGNFPGFTSINGVARPSFARLGGSSAGPTATAMISLTAQPSAVPADGSGGPAKLVFERTGDLSKNVFVTIKVKGNAVANVDYAALPTRKKLKHGKSSVAIDIVPLGSGTSGTKTLKIILVPGDGYGAGATTSVKVKLIGK